ncbi:NAD-dependent epimerase [Alishewanella sp. SMS8]|uniref:NAD-dependent epimerase n=1 Tax=Alishewanella sp. SMS8 TaxID=2994676 RepID=UPI0027421CDA|nr:NAD-dependent epimerase [Alishewanella sp. SMS8]MDP5460146.1 NAD-dependent epimerase [Alishewanella sp. SMS8]
MHYLVTGAAGFIGFYVCQRLLAAGHSVVGLDNLNDYYPVQLKHDRLAQLAGKPGFRFMQMDLADRAGIAALFAAEQFQRVIHLGAQAGVRYSLENPLAYADSNVIGTLTILEGCRHNKVEHLVYASSSSVYGMNAKMPFSTTDRVDHPVSLYAATKKSNELMAHTYSHLYGIPTTGLRFFTVYGPWGRPDMAPFLFTKAILGGEPIKVFNHGQMMRDFTYIDDIVEGIVRIQAKPPVAQPQWDGSNASESFAPYKIFNIGNNQPVKLMAFIEAIEQAAGKTAIKEYYPMQDGDVPATYADIDDLQAAVDFTPATSIDLGMQRFVDWYRGYYNVEC